MSQLSQEVNDRTYWSLVSSRQLLFTNTTYCCYRENIQLENPAIIYPSSSQSCKSEQYSVSRWSITQSTVNLLFLGGNVACCHKTRANSWGKLCGPQCLSTPTPSTSFHLFFRMIRFENNLHSEKSELGVSLHNCNCPTLLMLCLFFEQIEKFKNFFFDKMR